MDTKQTQKAGRFGKAMTVFFGVLFALLSAGCSTQKYTVEVGENQSVRLTIDAAMGSDQTEKLSLYGISAEGALKQDESSTDPLKKIPALLQELGAVYASKGFTVSPLNEAAETGLRAVKTYDTIQAFNEELKVLNEAGLCGLNGTLSQSSALTASTWQFSGELNFIEDPDYLSLTQEEKDLLAGVFDFSNFKAEARITLPGEISAVDGGSQERGNTILFTKPYQSGDTVYVRVRTMVQNTMLLNSLYGIAALAAAGLLFVLVRFGRKKKLEKEERDFYAGK